MWKKQGHGNPRPERTLEAVRSRRCSAAFLCRRLRLLVVDLKRLFLRWHGETSLHALLQSWHQHVIAESLPALLRLVDGHNGPATGRRSSRVEDLARGQCSPTGMDRRE